MKKSFLLVCITLIPLSFLFVANAQTEFVWQNPKPQGNTFYSTRFVNATTGWAVGNNGTIMKTVDGGKNWTTQKSNTTATLLCVYFIDQNTGWAVGSNTIIKTVNGGDTWSVLTTSAATALNTVYFFNATTGIFSGYGQIFRTTDGGKTLTSVAGGTTVNYSNLLSLFFINERRGWSAGTNGRVLNTIDGGLTWAAQTSNTTNRLNSVVFTDSINGFVYGDSGTRLVTTNGGTTWTASKVMNNHINSTFFINVNKGWGVTESNSDSTTIYKTIDGGKTWSPYWTGSDRALTSVTFVDSLKGWTVGHGGRILWTTNGGSTWTATSSGMTTPLISVHFLTPLLGWAVGEQGGIVKTTDGGTNWTAGKIPETGYLNGVYFLNKDTGLVVAGFGTKQIYKTYDGGNTWKTMTTPKTNYFLNSVQFTDGSVGWSVGLDGVILKTVNKGESWTEQTSGTTNALWGFHFFKPANTGTVINFNDTLGYAVGDKGTILKTSNGGAVWNALTSGISSTINTVFFIDSKNGWCGGQSGVLLRTRNGGVSWEKLTSTIYNTIYGIQFIDLNVGYAVGDYGNILKTSNGGDAWTSLNSGTANTLYALYFTDATTGYVVGKYGTILKTTNGGVSFTEGIKKPEPAYLIYPNPASDKITISHKGEIPEEATVCIFNMKGGLISQLKFKNQDRFEIDVKMLARGTYLITIDSETGIESKKLVIQ